MSTRKASVVPSEGRRKSIYERKASMEKNALELPAGMARRPSVDVRRMSMAGSLAGRSGLLSADRNKNVKYENTYKLEPDDRFPIYEAKKIALSVLNTNLEGMEYNKDDCQRLTRVMSDRIKQQTKALGHPRFKIVVIISIGQQQDTRPSMSFTSRCIWNDKLDSYAEATFKNRHLYAVALVYAMFTD